jgi:hypothetical protein
MSSSAHLARANFCASWARTLTVLGPSRPTRMRSARLRMRHTPASPRLFRRWSCSPIRARWRPSADRCDRTTKRVHHAVGGDVAVVGPCCPAAPWPVAKNSRGPGGTEENSQVSESRARRRSAIDRTQNYDVQFWPIAGRGRPVLSRIINSKKPAKMAARGSANIQNSVAGRMCPKEFT